MKKSETYSKWSDAESPEIAYQKVASGEWDLARFEEWVQHIELLAMRHSGESGGVE